jgi:hypothetical protein
MNSNDPTPIILVVFLMPLIFLVAGTWYGRSALGLRFWRAFLFCVGVTLGATATILVPSLIRPHGVERGYGQLHNNETLRLVFADVAVFLTLLLVAQLWQRWLSPQTIGDVKTAAAPTWLTPGQGVLALLLAASASWGWDWSFVGVLLLAQFAMVAHPLYHHKLALPPPPRAEPEPVNSGEREKVLAMLDAGRITVAESAELLNALAASAPAPAAARPAAAAFGGPRRLLLAGAAFVLVGFFLPWFSFNPGEQMQEMMSRMSPGGLIPNLPQVTMNTGSVQVEGGDVGRGLGWWILSLGLGAAVLPFVLPELAEQTWRRIAGLALLAGGILLVYLLHDTIRLAGVGIIIVFLGYGLEIVGVVQSGRKAG